jgi:hypothetical protein
MTTKTAVAKTPFFDRSTPARLGRSIFAMFFLLTLASIFFIFSWYAEHARLEKLIEMTGYLSSAAQPDFATSVDGFRSTVAIYNRRHFWLINGDYAVAAVLLIYITWQYLFILFRGNKAILQGTLLTFLLVGAVCGGANHVMRNEDVHVQRLIAESSQSISSNPHIANDRSTSPANQESHVMKAQASIQLLLAAPFLLVLGGLFYILAVNRSQSDYR